MIHLDRLLLVLLDRVNRRPQEKRNLEYQCFTAGILPMPTKPGILGSVIVVGFVLPGLWPVITI